MSPPLSYTVLSHLHAPVTVYGFILPIYLYHWWAVLFVPLAAQIGCMLDTIHTPDGSQAGNALTTATIFTLAALVHELASSASSSFSGFAGWFVSLLFSYIFAARLAHRKSNFTFAVFCSSVGIFAMAFQGVNGWSSTSASGSGSGSWQRWWPVGLMAAVLIALLILGLPGMPLFVPREELERSMYAPARQGYGTAHHRELDWHREQARQSRNRFDRR